MIAGIDYSTRFVDVVLLDEDTDAATWHRFALEGNDAFERARSVRYQMPHPAATFWDPIMAIGIEDPRGYNAGAIYRVQGAIIACAPKSRLIQPFPPSVWRKTVGLPGNCAKDYVRTWANVQRFKANAATVTSKYVRHEDWPQDACDAYCVALATRTLLQVAA